jgi:hypothetical protein
VRREADLGVDPVFARHGRLSSHGLVFRDRATSR